MRSKTIITVFLCTIVLSCGHIDKNVMKGISSDKTVEHKISNQVFIPQKDAIVNNRLVKEKKSLVQKISEPESKEIISKSIISPNTLYDVGTKIFEINATNGGQFSYEETGSIINIPPGSLVNKKGELVEGSVNIAYREFHTQKEIFFSGITMHIDVQGERQYFESAGMVQINAYKNNEAIFIKEGKEINIRMSTDNTNEEVMLYELDTLKKEWKEISKPKVITTRPTPSMKKKWAPVYNSEYQKVKERLPLNIYIKDYKKKFDWTTKRWKRLLNISISVNKNRKMKNASNRQNYIKANYFNHATFEIEGIRRSTFKKMMRILMQDSTSKYNGYSYTKINADIEITNVESPDHLTLILTYKDQKVTIPVRVNQHVHSSRKMKAKIFDIIANFQVNDFEGRFILKNKYVSYIDHYDSIYVYEEWYNKDLIQREFQAKNFGILNCDQPKKLPNDMVADATFHFNPDYSLRFKYLQIS